MPVRPSSELLGLEPVVPVPRWAFFSMFSAVPVEPRVQRQQAGWAEELVADRGRVAAFCRALHVRMQQPLQLEQEREVRERRVQEREARLGNPHLGHMRLPWQWQCWAGHWRHLGWCGLSLGGGTLLHCL